MSDLFFDSTELSLLDRRRFLQAIGTVGGAILLNGCGKNPVPENATHLLPGSPLALTADGKLLDTDFHDPFAKGTYLGYLPFEGEGKGGYDIDTRVREGHDARRVMEVATLLQPDGRTTPAEKHFIRTMYPDKLKPPAEWTISLEGHVASPAKIPLRNWLSFVEPHGSVLMECAGNATKNLRYGLLSVAEWSGIPFAKIIEVAKPTKAAKAVLIEGFDEHTAVSTHSTPTCSWIFTLDQLAGAKAFLATQMNGKPLDNDHGAPVRLMVPGWYGCCCAKWVTRISFVDDQQPATPQMLEFSTRTMQVNDPKHARNFQPATIDQAALPLRVEQWRLDGKIVYRIVGVTWGGPRRTENIQIRGKLGIPRPFAKVTHCETKTSNPEYGIWVHQWQPEAPGMHEIGFRINEPGISARKLDQYVRYVNIPPNPDAAT